MLHINKRPDAAGAPVQSSIKLRLMAWFMLITQWLNTTKKLSFIAPLLFRLFLAPIFITFGLNKAMHFERTLAWFGSVESGLGLPFPAVFLGLVIGAEVIGGALLLLGFLTRLTTVPLMITMLVALFAVHLGNGWYAIAPSNPQTNIATITQYVGFPGAKQSLENSKQVGEQLQAIQQLVQQDLRYNQLTEKGELAILNNGVEFAFIYFAMLLSLFFSGAGTLSLDHYITRQVIPWLMRR